MARALPLPVVIKLPGRERWLPLAASPPSSRPSTTAFLQGLFPAGQNSFKGLWRVTPGAPLKGVEYDCLNFGRHNDSVLRLGELVQRASCSRFLSIGVVVADRGHRTLDRDFWSCPRPRWKTIHLAP